MIKRVQEVGLILVLLVLALFLKPKLAFWVSFGIPIGPDTQQDPIHVAACQKVVDVANAAGLVPCHHGGTTAEEAARRFKEGFKMCQLGSDVGMVRAASANALILP